MDFYNIVTHAVAALLGVGAGFAIKVAIDSSKTNSHNTGVVGDSQGTVVQKGNKVGGSMAGRDVNAGRD